MVKTPGERAHDRWNEIMHGHHGAFRLLSPRAKLAWEAAAEAGQDEAAKAAENLSASEALAWMQKEKCANGVARVN